MIYKEKSEKHLDISTEAYVHGKLIEFIWRVSRIKREPVYSPEYLTIINQFISLNFRKFAPLRFNSTFLKSIKLISQDNINQETAMS